MISVFSLSYNYKAAQTKKDEKQREEKGEMSTRRHTDGAPSTRTESLCRQRSDAVVKLNARDCSSCF
jgi:hypothetical protein